MIICLFPTCLGPRRPYLQRSTKYVFIYLLPNLSSMSKFYVMSKFFSTPKILRAFHEARRDVDNLEIGNGLGSCPVAFSLLMVSSYVNTTFSYLHPKLFFPSVSKTNGCGTGQCKGMPEFQTFRSIL
jgi:hypothetical protein